MNKKNIFYVLHNNTNNNKFTYKIEYITCSLIIKLWRKTEKNIIIACKDKIQALKIDNLLWIHEPFSFIPHNLTENNQNTPIEISWFQCLNITNHNIFLINLMPICIQSMLSVYYIIDFVPYDESFYSYLSYNRYKKYNKTGFKTKFINIK